MNEIDHRIQDHELAHHMAIAEKPFKELAACALSIGLQSEYEDSMQKAEKASIRSGKEYVNKLMAQVAYFDSTDHLSEVTEEAFVGVIPDKLDSTPDTHELYKNVMVSNKDFKNFANEVDYTNSKARNEEYIVEAEKRRADNPDQTFRDAYQIDGAQVNGGVAGQAWGMLTRLYADLNRSQEDLDHYGRYAPLINVDFQIEPRAGKDNIAVSLKSLVELVEQYNGSILNDPSLKPQEILGKGFGPNGMQFISAFIEFTKNKIDESNK